MTRAFALVLTPEPAADTVGRRLRGALGSDADVAIDGNVGLGWSGGGRPAGDRWRWHMVGSVWQGMDVAELLETEGPEALARLRGRFALAAWRPTAGRALVAVDQLGAGAAFLYEDGSTLAVATELRELLRLLSRRPDPDRAAVGGWLAHGALAPGQTYYAGVRRLEGGQFLEIEGGSWRIGHYWTLRYRPPARLSAGEAAEQVRDGVREAVARRSAPPAASGLLLSGGLDSASVAAGAKLTGLERLRSYSAVFPQHPTIDERALISSVVDQLGLESKTVPVGSESMLAPGIEYLREWGIPSASPNLFLHRRLLRTAAADRVEVVLDGQGGDELFGCAAYLVADRLSRGRLRSGLELARRVPGAGPAPSGRVVRALLVEFGFKGMLPLAVHRAARRVRGPAHYTPPWLSEETARSAVAADPEWSWKALDGPRWWAQLADAVTLQRERTGAHDFLRRKNRLAGVEGAHPFLDDLDLIQLALSLPPALSFHPEYDRPLLRAAMEGLLPDAVRLRREKSYFNALFATCLDGVDGDLVRRLLTAREAEVRSYVRPDAVAKLLLDPPPERRPRGWGWAVWRLVGIECWLRAENDREFLARALASRGDLVG